MTAYYIYLLRCKDNSLYAGITTDPQRRLLQHQSETGAKYTRSHGAVAMEAVWRAPTRSVASRVEYRLKQLSKEKKENLTVAPQNIAQYIPECAAWGVTVDNERA